MPSCPDFIAQHRTHPQHFPCQRHLTFRNLILFLPNQPNSALKNELEALNQALHVQMDGLGLHHAWQGMRLLAVDGSSMHLPLEEPLARVSALMDLLSDQALHTLVITPDVDERGCASIHLEQALDDGTVSMICRDRIARQVCKQSGVGPDAPLQIRLVRVTLPTGETEVLATSLLDSAAFPAELLADQYHRPGALRPITTGSSKPLTLENVGGRTVCAVQQDIHAYQLLKNMALLIQALPASVVLTSLVSSSMIPSRRQLKHCLEAQILICDKNTDLIFINIEYA